MDEEMVRAYSSEDGWERLSLSIKKKLGCFAIYLTEQWINSELELPHNIPYGVMEHELQKDGAMYYHITDVDDDVARSNAYVYNLCLKIISLQKLGKITRFFMLGSHNEVINYVNLSLGLMGIMYKIHESRFSLSGMCFEEFFGNALGVGDRLNELIGQDFDFSSMSNGKQQEANNEISC